MKETFVAIEEMKRTKVIDDYAVVEAVGGFVLRLALLERFLELRAIKASSRSVPANVDQSARQEA